MLSCQLYAHIQHWLLWLQVAIEILKDSTVNLIVFHSKFRGKWLQLFGELWTVVH